MKKIIFITTVLFYSTLYIWTNALCDTKITNYSNKLRFGSDDVIFKKIFVKDKSISLDYGGNVLYILGFISVDNNNNIIITDPAGKQVLIFSETGHLVKVLASEGKGPGEVLMPTVVTIGDSGKIYLVDHVMRRISIFSSDYKFKDSFIFRTRHQQPSCMAKVRNYIFMSGANVLKYDVGPDQNIVARKRPLLINKYMCSGKYLKSFYPIYSEFVDTKLKYDQCYFYIYHDSIYAVQEHKYRVNVFNLDGVICRSFGNPSKYFKQVKRTDIPKIKTKLTDRERSVFRISYSRIVKILIVNDYLILQESVPLKNINDEDDFNKGNYKIDIFTVGGRLIISGVSSTKLEMACAGKDSILYFVEYEDFGDESHPPKYIIGKYRLNTELLKKIEEGL